MTDGKDPSPKTAAPGGEDGGHLWGRRSALTYLSFAGLGASTLAGLAGAIRFGYPRVLFEPPLKFKAGSPDEYRVGEVSTRWIPQSRVWLIREREGFYGLYASCTHLGCTPRWMSVEEKFKCFCHGSGFYKDGINFEGPAPRPLERVKVGLGEDGQLVVDTSVRFRFERGDWEKPGSFLKL